MTRRVAGRRPRSYNSPGSCSRPKTARRGRVALP